MGRLCDESSAGTTALFGAANAGPRSSGVGHQAHDIASFLSGHQFYLSLGTKRTEETHPRTRPSRCSTTFDLPANLATHGLHAVPAIIRGSYLRLQFQQHTGPRAFDERLKPGTQRST
jgi:hypothetical protein